MSDDKKNKKTFLFISFKESSYSQLKADIKNGLFSIRSRFLKKDKKNKNKIPFIFSVLRFFNKCLLVSIFLIYLIFGGALSWSWIYTKNTREIPLAKIYDVIQDKRNSDDLRGAMALLKARRIVERPEIIEILEPHLGELEPFFSFVVSRFYLDEARMYKSKLDNVSEENQEDKELYEAGIMENIEEAVFWSQAARFRLRYDGIRCGHLNSKEISDKISFIGTPFEIDNYLTNNPRRLKPLLRRVLDWDKKYDKIPRPDYLCRMMDAFNMSRTKTGYVPEERWEDMRDTMHVVTAFFIESEDKKPTKEIEDIFSAPPLSGQDNEDKK